MGRVANDDGSGQIEPVEEFGQIRSEIPYPIASLGLVRVAVPALRYSDSSEGRRQICQHPLETAPGVSEAVEEYDCRCIAIALDDVRKR
jgi:hypothetical protein